MTSKTMIEDNTGYLFEDLWSSKFAVINAIRIDCFVPFASSFRWPIHHSNLLE